jgi:hypothetical protein
MNHNWNFWLSEGLLLVGAWFCAEAFARYAVQAKRVWSFVAFLVLLVLIYLLLTDAEAARYETTGADAGPLYHLSYVVPRLPAIARRRPDLNRRPDRRGARARSISE